MTTLPNIPFMGFLLLLFAVLLAGGIVIYSRENLFYTRLEAQRVDFEKKLGAQRTDMENELGVLRAENHRLSGQVDILARLLDKITLSASVNIENAGTLSMQDLAGRNIKS